MSPKEEKEEKEADFFPEVVISVSPSFLVSFEHVLCNSTDSMEHFPVMGEVAVGMGM